jgi:catechol 2,3-dioxygenase-like lactoylglutathione lyase family enzyme
MELGWPTWIGVVVDDLEKQRRFYRDALGFRETGSSEGWVHLEFPGDGLFELVQRAPSPQYDAKRYQVGFTVQDLQATREELIRRGVEPISEIEGLESGPAMCGATSAMPRTMSSRSRNGSKHATSRFLTTTGLRLG